MKWNTFFYDTHLLQACWFLYHFYALSGLCIFIICWLPNISNGNEMISIKLKTICFCQILLYTTAFRVIWDFSFWKDLIRFYRACLDTSLDSRAENWILMSSSHDIHGFCLLNCGRRKFTDTREVNASWWVVIAFCAKDPKYTWYQGDFRIAQSGIPRPKMAASIHWTQTSKVETLLLGKQWSSWSSDVSGRKVAKAE